MSAAYGCQSSRRSGESEANLQSNGIRIAEWEYGGVWDADLDTFVYFGDPEDHEAADVQLFQGKESGVALEAVNGAQITSANMNDGFLVLLPGIRFRLLTNQNRLLEVEVSEIREKEPRYKEVVTIIRYRCVSGDNSN
jgi:hypothetical protein